MSDQTDTDNSSQPTTDPTNLAWLAPMAALSAIDPSGNAVKAFQSAYSATKAKEAQSQGQTQPQSAKPKPAHNWPSMNPPNTAGSLTPQTPDSNPANNAMFGQIRGLQGGDTTTLADVATDTGNPDIQNLVNGLKTATTYQQIAPVLPRAIAALRTYAMSAQPSQNVDANDIQAIRQFLNQYGQNMIGTNQGSSVGTK